MYNLDQSPIHLAGMNLFVCENASGAPAAVILPFDSDTERELREDEAETLWCQ